MGNADQSAHFTKAVLTTKYTAKLIKARAMPSLEAWLPADLYMARYMMTSYVGLVNLSD